MARLVRENGSTFIYDDFKGEEQIVFQCATETEDRDLQIYVNQQRVFLFEVEDTETTNLHEVEGYKLVAYWRMYFSGGSWGGRWFWENEDEKELRQIKVAGIDEIIKRFINTFPNGCDYSMKQWLERFNNWGNENRYLLKPAYSDIFKIQIDTTYGNNDYPVRIYVYEKEVL